MWKVKQNGIVTVCRKLVQNQILLDYNGNKWIIGDMRDMGRFAEIYTACHVDDPENFICTLKMEPFENGPLFREMHFYVRNGLPAQISGFENAKGIKSLGIPVLLSSGSLIEDRRYRFLILPRYGKNLATAIKERGGKLSVDTVKDIAVQLLYCFEYMHGRNYIYGDLKPANIVFEYEQNDGQVYLIDYGEAEEFMEEKLFPNPTRTHNALLCYTSRDTHLGIVSFRSDLEMLVYNLIDWMKGKLPWKHLDQEKKVYEKKIKYMSNLKNIPAEVRNYADYVNKLELQEIPSYSVCREFFLPKDVPSTPPPSRLHKKKGKPIEIEDISPDYGSLSHIKQFDVYE